MNPMVHLILLGEKRVEIDQERSGQHRFGQDEFLNAGWSRPKRRISILAWLPRLQLNRRQPRVDCLPEAGC
jgi:hypothetical protein